MNLEINVTNVDDAVKMRLGPILEEMFCLAKRVIDGGGQVVLKIVYVNAQPEVLRTLRTKTELNEWQSWVRDSYKGMEQ